MTGSTGRLPKAKRPERSRSAHADRVFPVRRRRYPLRRRKIKAERQGTASPVERRLNGAAAAAPLLPKRQPGPGVATSTQSRSPPRTAPRPPQRLEIAGQESRVAGPRNQEAPKETSGLFVFSLVARRAGGASLSGSFGNVAAKPEAEGARPRGARASLTCWLGSAGGRPGWHGPPALGVAVFQRLSFAPPVFRAPEDFDDVAPR